MDKVREQRMTDMQKLYDAILNGDARNATAVTQEALDAGADPLMLVTDFMVPAMDEVGRVEDGREH
jgi:methanogenic corrinoid protein MtbC1